MSLDRKTIALVLVRNGIHVNEKKAQIILDCLYLIAKTYNNISVYFADSRHFISGQTVHPNFYPSYPEES